LYGTHMLRVLVSRDAGKLVVVELLLGAVERVAGVVVELLKNAEVVLGYSMEGVVVLAIIEGTVEYIEEGPAGWNCAAMLE
jgi:hypothetical protein